MFGPDAILKVLTQPLTQVEKPKKNPVSGYFQNNFYRGGGAAVTSVPLIN